MVKRIRPKQVRLLDGGTFKDYFKCATQADLPSNVTFLQIYKQRVVPKGRRRQQRSRGFNSVLGKAFRLAKRVAGSKMFKNVARMGLAELPGAVEKLSNKVKNQRLKSILDSDITKTGVNLATGYALDKLG